MMATLTHDSRRADGRIERPRSPPASRSRSRKRPDPRVVYMLHEIGEESRHSRAFIRLIEELGPKARNPFERGLAV